MTRSIVVPGETMVYLRFGEHLSGQFGATEEKFNYVELGLAADGVRLTPSHYYDDIKVDDFGRHACVDVQHGLASVSIDLSLMHYDREVLWAAQDESLGGAGTRVVNGAAESTPGAVPPAGKLQAGRRPIYWSGNHFFSVLLGQTSQTFATRYIACQLTNPSPGVTRLAANAEPVNLSFRAIPYWNPVRSGGTITDPAFFIHGGIQYTRLKEIQSSGAVIWDFGELLGNVL